jgi:hypothetical protein
VSLRERIAGDNARLMNLDQFGERHMWDNTEITCIIDREAALKRKNNNVVDLSWDFNYEELVLYALASAFTKKPLPQQTVLFDRNMWRVLQVGEDEGMLNVLLVRRVAKEVL